MFDKDKQTEENPGMAKQVRDMGFGLVGCAAGACAGLVVKAGLEMITPPAMEPVVEIGYKVGKWVIAGVATTVIEHAVANELTQTCDELASSIEGVKKAAKINKKNNEKTEEEVEEVL